MHVTIKDEMWSPSKGRMGNAAWYMDKEDKKDVFTPLLSEDRGITHLESMQLLFLPLLLASLSLQ